MEYKKYRVKTTIKKTLKFISGPRLYLLELFTLNPPDGTHNKHLENELEVLRELSKYVPKYIAESYGDRYGDKTLGIKKLEKPLRLSPKSFSSCSQVCLVIAKQKVWERL